MKVWVIIDNAKEKKNYIIYINILSVRNPVAIQVNQIATYTIRRI